MSSDPSNTIEQLNEMIEACKGRIRSRVTSYLSEVGETEMPELLALRDEQRRLEQDLSSCNEEMQTMHTPSAEDQPREDLIPIYRLALRLQRMEDFVMHAYEYVDKDLSEEVRLLSEADRRTSQEEVAMYIQTLQSKREEEKGRVEQLQQRIDKRAKEVRETAHVEHGTMGAKVRVMKPKKDVIDKDTLKIMEYTESAKGEKQNLTTKVRDLRHEKSNLEARLIDARHKNEKAINDYKARIRSAELAHQRDIRLCQELNTGNAALTTNAQILMGQLNVEHYGMACAPSDKMLIKARKREEKWLAYAAAHNLDVDGTNKKKEEEAAVAVEAAAAVAPEESAAIHEAIPENPSVNEKIREEDNPLSQRNDASKSNVASKTNAAASLVASRPISVSNAQDVINTAKSGSVRNYEFLSGSIEPGVIDSVQNIKSQRSASVSFAQQESAKNIKSQRSESQVILQA